MFKYFIFILCLQFVQLFFQTVYLILQQSLLFKQFFIFYCQFIDESIYFMDGLGLEERKVFIREYQKSNISGISFLPYFIQEKGHGLDSFLLILTPFFLDFIILIGKKIRFAPDTFLFFYKILNFFFKLLIFLYFLLEVIIFIGEILDVLLYGLTEIAVLDSFRVDYILTLGQLIFDRLKFNGKGYYLFILSLYLSLFLLYPFLI